MKLRRPASNPWQQKCCATWRNCSPEEKQHRACEAPPRTKHRTNTLDFETWPRPFAASMTRVPHRRRRVPTSHRRAGTDRVSSRRAPLPAGATAFAAVAQRKRLYAPPLTVRVLVFVHETLLVQRLERAEPQLEGIARCVSSRGCVVTRTRRGLTSPSSLCDCSSSD